VAGLIIRGMLAAALVTLALALILLTRELAHWRSHVPDVMAQSTSWQKQTSGIQDQTAQLQPKIEAALTVTHDVVMEAERVRREIPPMLREIERARQTVSAVLPRVDGAILRIDGIEQTLPEVLKTANEAVAEVKRANDALPTVIQEVRAVRTEAEQLVAHAEKVVRDSRKAGKEASEGAVAGIFTGVFKLPFTPVERLRHSHQDTLSFEQQLSDQDRDIVRERSVAALSDRKLGSVYPWHNDKSGHSGTITVLSAYKRQGRPCREVSYRVLLKGELGQHKPKILF
jgi:surface antigen